MANFYGKFKSAPFEVKDIEKFKEWLRLWNTEDDIICTVHSEAENIVCICCDDHVPGNKIEDVEEHEPEESDFFEELAKHLKPDTAVCITEIGYEKLRFLSAYAVCVTAKGDIISVDAASEALKRCREEFGIDPMEY